MSYTVWIKVEDDAGTGDATWWSIVNCEDHEAALIEAELIVETLDDMGYKVERLDE